MAKKKLYPYFDGFVSMKEILEMKNNQVGIKWVTGRLNKGMSVQAILDDPILTHSQRARKTVKEYPTMRPDNFTGVKYN